MTRLPTQHDVDEYGMVTIAIKDGKGGYKIKKVAAVDAREIIYSEAGTLDIPEKEAKEEAKKDVRQQLFDQMDLDRLREVCKANQISYTGKPPTQLRSILMEAGVDPAAPIPPQEDEE